MKKPKPHKQQSGPSFVKRTERRFFDLFNDKTKLRKNAFIVLLAGLPAYGYGTMQEEKPATQRGAQGAAHVQQFRSEIAELARESFTLPADGTTPPAMNAETRTRYHNIEARAQNLAQRLALDTNISEDDAERLSRLFLNTMQEGSLGIDLPNQLHKIRSNAAFLQEARDQAAQNGNYATAQIAQKAEQVLKNASEESSDDFWYGFFLSYLVAYSILKGSVEAMLRGGTRRDNKLKQEERNDTFRDTTRDIRDMLAPKDAPPAGAASPRKKSGPKQ